MNNKKILVIGDIMLDHYIFTKSNRLSTESPTPICIPDYESFVLGGAANVAANIKSLGGDVELIGVVGGNNPDNAHRINSMLLNKKFKLDNIYWDDRKTTVKQRIIVNGHQFLRIDDETIDDINEYLQKQIIKYCSKNIRYVDVVIFCDYLKGVLTNSMCCELINYFKQNNKLIICAHKGYEVEKFSGCDILLSNIKEAELAVGYKYNEYENEYDYDKFFNELYEDLIFKYGIITLGDEGLVCWDKHSGNTTKIESNKKEVYDVCGAGDVVLAALSAYIHRNGIEFFEEACEFANKVAGISVTKFGTCEVTKDEVENG